MIKLRDYQQSVINEVNYHLKQGHRKLLIEAPTGGGKSIIVAKLIQQFLAAGKKIAVVAHRAKLLSQLENTIKATGGGKVSYLMAGRKTNYESDIYLCMAQTMSSKKRVMPDVEVILVDEVHCSLSHHGTKKLIDHNLGSIYCLSEKIVIGLTATPYRLKRMEGLCWLFDWTIQAPSPRKLIDQGYLCKPTVYVHDSDSIKLSSVKIDISTGDYDEKALRRILNMDYVEDCIDKWETVESDSKTIVFVSSVAQCLAFTEEFNRRGYSAKMITGMTTKRERKQIFAEYDANEFQILIAVNVLTEGFDQPDVKTVLLCRPTKSLALACQMIGRGLRLHPSKDYANIIDCSGFLIQFGHMQTRKDENGDEYVNDFFDTLSKNLCPSAKAKGEPPIKTCVNEDCGEGIPAPALICPHCGTAQPTKEKKTPDSYPALIQIEGKGMDMKQMKVAYRWLYKRMHSAFEDMVSPEAVLDDYFIKFKEEVDPSWLRGLFFGSDPNPFKRSVMTYYLSVACRMNKQLIQKYYTYEFGDDVRLVKPFSPSQYLGIVGSPKDLTRTAIDEAYFLAITNSNKENCQTINMAYREVLRRCGFE